jgi:hypothetical protein
MLYIQFRFQSFNHQNHQKINPGSLASTMFVLVASLWTVIAQPLDSIQHSALMDVYDGLGSFLLRTPPKILCEI